MLALTDDFCKLLKWTGTSFFALIFLVISACSQDRPEPEIISLSDEDTEQTYPGIEESVNVELEEGLEITLWASEEMLGDPIGIHMDDLGRAHISVTNRSRNSEFDIRDLDPKWLIESMKWETVEDRRDYLHEELSPERSDQNTWLWDHNEDGSHDWRDLTVKKEEIWRLEDLSGNGRANRAQLFIRDFHDEVTDVAGAVLNHNDEVFVGVGPDMWRVRDTTGDGIGDWKESISHGYNVHIGFSGHGMSGLKLGPDGRIYWGIGDMGFSVVDQDGNHWHYPNQGAILRSEPDGSNFEVYAAGLRNTHEFTFDKYGNLITVDNDGDYPREFERLVYLFNGSDSGWRINWQFGKYTDPRNNNYNVWMDEDLFKPHWEDQSAHILPPLSQYHAGPAGMAYNPGTALSEEWKDHFFVMSFRGSTANSPINAFTLEEDGASFRLDTDREIMRGILAVGIDFGPDGALYLTDWIQGWGQKNEGRIWKLDSPEHANSLPRVEKRQLLTQDFSAFDTQKLGRLMGDEDMRVRQKAQFELAERDDRETLLSMIEDSEHQLARIHGIWGIGQIGRTDREAVAVLVDFLTDDDREIRTQAAKMLGDVRFQPASGDLIPMLEDEELRVQFYAAKALGRIGDEDAFDPIVNMLEANNDEDIYIRQVGAIALSRVDNGERVAGLAEHDSRAVRIAAIAALKRLEHPGSERFLQDEDEYIVTNAARAISDDAFVENAMPALARMTEQEEFINEPLIRRAINANLYGGSAEDANRLAEFATRTGIDNVLRIEALNTLEIWPEPSIFDRVTGRHRGEVENNPDYAMDAIDPVVKRLLDDGSADVRIAALNMIAGLGYTGAEDRIVDLLNNDPSVDVRIASLNALLATEYDEIDEAFEIALNDSNIEARTSALGRIAGIDLPEESVVALLASVLEEGTIGERQTVLQTLGEMDAPASYGLLERQLERLIEQELEPELELDLVLAVEATTSMTLREKLSEYEEGKDEGPVAQYREALYGGSAENGERIFYQDAAAQCVRCHVVAGQGGEVGPELTDLGSSMNREGLLRSLVDPSANVAPGFGNVTVVLESGESVQGLLEAESDQTITITIGGQQREIEKSDIAERISSPSSMPAMGDLLSRSQLRDLVEYMTTLQNE